MPGRLLVIIGTALIASALAPAAGAAKVAPPEPQMDSARVTGQVDGSASIPGPEFRNIDIDASSGPSGEDPSGDLSIDFCVFIRGECVWFEAVGRPTCLNVTGNRATIGSILGGSFNIGPAIVTVVDNGGSGADRFQTQLVVGPTPDCSQHIPSTFLDPLDGRARVFDGRPPPTMRAQCKDGGWKRWSFENQGRCVAFVSTS